MNLKIKQWRGIIRENKKRKEALVQCALVILSESGIVRRKQWDIHWRDKNVK